MFFRFSSHLRIKRGQGG